VEATAGAAWRGPSLGPAIVAATGDGRARFGLLEFGRISPVTRPEIRFHHCFIRGWECPGRDRALIGHGRFRVELHNASFAPIRVPSAFHPWLLISAA
jgi:hypothetical protein